MFIGVFSFLHKREHQKNICCLFQEQDWKNSGTSTYLWCLLSGDFTNSKESEIKLFLLSPLLRKCCYASPSGIFCFKVNKWTWGAGLLSLVLFLVLHFFLVNIHHYIYWKYIFILRWHNKLKYFDTQIKICFPWPCSPYDCHTILDSFGIWLKSQQDTQCDVLKPALSAWCKLEFGSAILNCNFNHVKGYKNALFKLVTFPAIIPTYACKNACLSSLRSEIT